ncbi:(2Fe-2S)-binding protein [Paenibacillus sp. P22]|uniref:(2Fe-2S)-binding protein n=1 Tax=Paenibacillus sp. P22 TaxID=483908 RepID=UPI00038FD32B|nr:(2Fe-2S)-binding protein [Paenibacillus sp. P22]CDN43480.1 hypothetical protein BN871_CZ_00510 [Paenibacillus sp. P22]
MNADIRQKLSDKHGLLWELPDGIHMTATAEELARPDTASRFLELYAGLLPSTSIQPSATYFCSWARSLTSAVHWLLASRGGCLSVAPQDWTVVLAKPGAYASISFMPSSATLVTVEGDGSAIDPQTVMDRLYGELIAPIFRTFADVSGVRQNDLWRLMATNLNYTKATLLADSPAENEFMSLESDFRYVLTEMPGEKVGLDRNPLAIPMRYVDNPYKPGEQSMMRASCCLAYMTDFAKYCYTCPRLKSSERDRMIQEIREMQKV